MMRTKAFFFLPYLLWIALFVITPLMLIIYQSFLDLSGHLTWQNYLDYLGSGVYLKMTVNSVRFAAMITFVTLLLAYPTAIILTHTRLRQFWLMVVILPTWINLLLKTYSFIGILSQNGSINHFLAFAGLGTHQLLFRDSSFILVAAYIELPFMILPIFNSLAAIPSSLRQAAADLGANRWQTFRRVSWPLSLPGVKSGIQAVFIPSLSLFMITRLIAGNRVITLGTAIEEHFLTTQNWGMGSTIGVVLILAMFVVMALTGEPNKGGGRRREKNK